MAAMHRQEEEEEVLFCHSNNCTIHNNPLIFYNPALPWTGNRHLTHDDTAPNSALK